MAAFYLLGGVIELIVIGTASSALPTPFGGGDTVAAIRILGGLFVVILTTSAAVMVWAMADMIDIAVRLAKTLPG
jgi:hypothetical protein